MSKFKVQKKLIMFFLLLIALLVFYSTGCSDKADLVPDDSEVDQPVLTEEPEHTTEAESKDEIASLAEEKNEGELQGYFDAFNIYWDFTQPALSTNKEYLLGPKDDHLVLFSFPEGNLIERYPDLKSSGSQFIWHPKSEAFITILVEEQRTDLYYTEVNSVPKLIYSFPSDSFSLWWLGWAFSGDSFILSHEKNEECTLYLIDIDGSIVNQVTIDKCYGVRSPLISNDGTKLFFVPVKTESEDLWFWDLKTGLVKQVTKDNHGDYPDTWLDQDRLLVRVGSIGTGGGNPYGISIVNPATGNRLTTYYISMDNDTQTRQIVKNKPEQHWNATYILHAVSPDGSLALGEDFDWSGSDPVIAILNLQSGVKREIISGANLNQAIWLNNNKIVLNIADYQDAGYKNIVFLYDYEGELITLVEKPGDIFLIDYSEDELHYLWVDGQAGWNEGNQWIWEINKVDN